MLTAFDRLARKVVKTHSPRLFAISFSSPKNRLSPQDRLATPRLQAINLLSLILSCSHVPDLNIMASQMPERYTYSYEFEREVDRHAPQSHVAPRRGQIDASNQLIEPTFTATASIKSSLGNLPRGSSLHAYERSREPIDKRTTSETYPHYHNQSITAASRLNDDADEDDSTRSLDQFMTIATQYPELAEQYKDVEPKQARMADLYKSSAAETGGDAHHHYSHSNASRDTMEPVMFHPRGQSIVRQPPRRR